MRLIAETRLAPRAATAVMMTRRRDASATYALSSETVTWKTESGVSACAPDRGEVDGCVGVECRHDGPNCNTLTCDDTACVAESMLPTTLADAELLERWRALEALPLPPPGVSADDDAVSLSSSSACAESTGGVEPSASSPPGRTCFTVRRTP